MINVGELILNNANDEHYNLYPNLDAKYGPYESIEIALTNVPKSQRAIGLTIGIKSNNSITEYWFKSSIEDSGLVAKGNTVDLSDYYTKSQIDASQRTQDNKIVATENRLTAAENKIVAAEGLTQAGEWRMGGSQNGDLTSVFSVASEATCEYRYLYQYGGAQSDGWALKVPNGQYKIRILSCTTETNDKYINFHTFNINTNSVLDQLPLEKALTNNTEWVEFDPITVTNEVIWIYAAVNAKNRCGINAIEIIKL